MSAPPSLSATVTGIDADGTLANAAAKHSLESLGMKDVVGDISDEPRKAAGTNSNGSSRKIAAGASSGSRRGGGGALVSSGRHSAPAGATHVASYFTQTKQRLDRVRCTSLTLQQLAAKLPAVKTDSRHGTPFTDIVGERARHAVHVANLLDRDPADFPPLVFPPGGVVDAIEELIDSLESELAHSKSSSSGGVEMPLCETFIRGECTRGVTCSLSHSRDAVTGWVTPWLRKHTHSNAAVINQLAKAAPEGSPLPPVQCTLTTADFPLGQEAWAVIVDAVRSSRWSEHRPPLGRIVARHVTKSALKVIVPAVQYNWLHSLAALDLSKNELPAKMVLKLAAALPTNPMLAELNLSDCKLGLAGALVILRAVSTDPPKPAKETTTTTTTGNGGAAARAPAALRDAVNAARDDDAGDDIAHVPVTSQSYLPPPNARCGIKALNLAANSINSADPAFSHLCVAFADALPYLEKLNLAENGLGPEALRRLLKGPMERYPVTSSSTSSSSATSKAAFPPPLPALRFLNLSNNRLGDSGFAAIGEMLYGTTVGRSLLFLDLSWNRATHEGAASVANAIGKAARESASASSAAGSPHAGQSVVPSPHGQHLPSHASSPMTMQQQEELLGAFASSQSMAGFGNNSVFGRSGDAASLMASMQAPPHTPGNNASPKSRSAPPPQLQSLNLHYNLSFGRKGALAIAQLLKAETSLTAVDLRWTSLGDEGLASLQEALMANRQVLELPIAGNEVDARGQEALALRLKKRLERGTPPGVITHGACVW